MARMLLRCRVIRNHPHGVIARDLVSFFTTLTGKVLALQAEARRARGLDE
jgi:hypothetical protein